MKKLFFLLIALIVVTASHLKIKKNAALQDDHCSNTFMIISRATGYSLSLAIQVTDQNGKNYYWTVTNQNVNAIPETHYWVKCDSGLKNLYNNQYLYIDGARNAILVDKMQTKVDFNNELYPGYTLIVYNRVGSCLTTLDDGASFFAANYKGLARWEIYQQWNIHYI